MLLNRFPLLLIGIVMSAAGLTACATTAPTASPSVGTTSTTPAIPTHPGTPTATPTPTAKPTPSPTLDADQAAALDVVERYSAVMAEVRANPAKYDQYKMIELLKPLAFDDMIQANLNGLQPWRDKGWHAEGSVLPITSSASTPTKIADGTRRVIVTVCRDQRGLSVLDKRGKKVTAEAAQFPEFLKNTYDMRKPTSGTFRLWELAGEAVEGCAP